MSPGGEKRRGGVCLRVYASAAPPPARKHQKPGGGNESRVWEQQTMIPLGGTCCLSRAARDTLAGSSSAAPNWHRRAKQ